MTDTNNYSLSIYIVCLKFIKPVKCVDANHETVIDFEFLSKIKFDVAQRIDKSIRGGCVPCSCAVKFNKGKSVMFKLSDKDFRKDDTKEIPLNMEVYQRLQHSCLPTRLVVGKAVADLRPLINAAYNDKEDNTYRRTYEVKNENSEIAALLDLSLIMVKLDQVIINDFSISDEGQCFMSMDDKKGPGKGNMLDLDKKLNLLSDIANCPVDKVDGTRDFTKTQTDSSCCCPVGSQGLPIQMKNLVKDQADAGTEAEDFLGANEYQCEEISAIMNGNAVRIRIPRKKGAGVTQGATKVADSSKSDGAIGDKPERTMLFGENEVIMTMRQKGPEDETDDEGEGFHTQFTAGDPHSGKPTVNITPTSVPGSVEALKVIETDKDVFVLKINKKCHTKDKATLELELATPKPPPKPAPPTTDTRSSQYDPNDCPPPTPPPPPPPEPEPEPPPPPSPPKKGKGKKGKK